MKNIIILLVGLFIGILLSLFAFQLLNVQLDTTKTHSVLEVVYYVTSPFGVFFTALAIVVAIWGNDIRGFLNKEKCDVEIENGGFVEDVRGIDEDEQMEARMYNCNLIIKNSGAKEIESCTVFITKILYKQEEKSKGKSIGLNNRMPLYWFDPNIKSLNIFKGERRVIPVLRVYPDSNIQTPDFQNKRLIPRRFSIMGFNIEGRYSQKGIWEISYMVCNSHEPLKEFKLVAQWNGEWHRREKEMNDSLTVHIL